MRKVYGNHSEATDETGDGNEQPHSQSFQIKGKTPLDFTATYVDLVEVAEAPLGCKPRFVGRHSLLDVGARTHFNMKA